MSVSMTGWPLVAVISVLQIGHSSGECWAYIHIYTQTKWSVAVVMHSHCCLPACSLLTFLLSFFFSRPLCCPDCVWWGNTQHTEHGPAERPAGRGEAPAQVPEELQGQWVHCFPRPSTWIHTWECPFGGGAERVWHCICALISPYPCLVLYLVRECTQTYHPGKSINEYMRKDIPNELKLRLVDLCAVSLLEMVFAHNFVHGDLHPGTLATHR